MKAKEKTGLMAIPAQLSIGNDRLSHAYIASGALADALAMAVVCSGTGASRPCMNCKHCGKASRRIHPDIAFIDKYPDKQIINVDQIRELKQDAFIIPIESEKKAYIINNADLMNASAQNAFLQILEEPPSHSVFILSTENPTMLLPTVRSRCVPLTASPSREAPDTLSGEMADEFFSALEKGNVPLAAFMFRLEKLDKAQFAGFIEAARGRAITKLRDASTGESAIHQKILAKAEETLIKAGEMLDLNVNTGHISGLICASLMHAAESQEKVGH